MNLTAMIKQKTLRLIGLVLIAMPLIAFYTILRVLDVSAKIASITTVCLSGVAFLVLIIYVEPFLHRLLQTTSSKPKSRFSALGPEQSSTNFHSVKGPLYTGNPELDFDSSNFYLLRGRSGNWIHS